MTRSGRPRPAVGVRVALTGVLGCVLAGCAGGLNASRATGGYIQGDYAITVVAPADRDDAPDAGGETLDGDRVSLDDYAGRTVVLNIWGAWCVACREEAAALVTAQRRLSADRVVFLGIDIRDSDDSARAYERSYGITWPSISDQDSSLLLGFRDTTLPPPAAPPTTYVIDPQGRLGARIATADLTATTLVDVVDEVVHG